MNSINRQRLFCTLRVPEQPLFFLWAAWQPALPYTFHQKVHLAISARLRSWKVSVR